MAAERGSGRLPHFGGHGKTISEDALKRIYSMAEIDGVKLIDWWWLGQPAPDVVGGTFQVDPSALGTIVSNLALQNEVRLNLQIFPYGIVNPELVNVEFVSQGGER
jgi:hypothetical protein